MDLKRYLRAQWDRVSGVALVALGAVALLLGWIGVSGTPLPSEQVPYVISGGLAGLALVGVGATVWLSADLRDEWRKLTDLEDAVRQSAAAAQSQAEAPPTPLSNGSGSKSKRPVAARSGASSDDS